MAACPGVCHLAALMLLTLGGKNDLTPQQQRVEMGKGWRSLDVSWTLARLAFWAVQMWGSEGGLEPPEAKVDPVLTPPPTCCRSPPTCRTSVSESPECLLPPPPAVIPETRPLRRD